MLWALLYRGPSRHGVCDPSIGQLAAWSGCARSTVQLALSRIEAAGIMGHVRRGLVVAGRWCQWTSAYLFASPEQWAASDTEARSAEVSLEKKKAMERGREGRERPAGGRARCSGGKMGAGDGLGWWWQVAVIQPAVDQGNHAAWWLR
ncbi:hypothetical protein ACFQU7_43345 [Pseudoroseomonas wenyumeiae]